MKRRDLLLVTIGDKMQPIQLQKTLFKFAMESGLSGESIYQFEPYDWGPCSFEIYRDIDDLVAENLVRTIPSGRGWNYYQLTEDGEKQVQKARKKTKDRKSIAQLDEIRTWVINRSFRQLLTDVYNEYPAFAANSLFTN